MSLKLTHEGPVCCECGGPLPIVRAYCPRPGDDADGTCRGRVCGAACDVEHERRHRALADAINARGARVRRPIGAAW